MLKKELKDRYTPFIDHSNVIVGSKCIFIFKSGFTWQHPKTMVLEQIEILELQFHSICLTKVRNINTTYSQNDMHLPPHCTNLTEHEYIKLTSMVSLLLEYKCPQVSSKTIELNCCQPSLQNRYHKRKMYAFHN